MRQETGLLDPDFDEITENPERTWKQSEYLRQRWQELEPVMQELDPLKPVNIFLKMYSQMCNLFDIIVILTFSVANIVLNLASFNFSCTTSDKNA